MSSILSCGNINAKNYVKGLGINRNRIVLHSDINSFFAAVECVKNPKIAKLPVAVCGEAQLRHGIVLAKNQVAKEFDIKTGDTISDAKRKCPGIQIVNPDYPLYMEYAEKIRRLYYNYSDRVEPFGMDEAFIELTDCFGISNLSDGKNTADRIREEVFEKTGLTVSVGVSDNKAFAKLASDYKKPYATTVLGPFNYEKVIAPLDVSDMLYVGRHAKSRLNSHGIFTIGEAANTDEHILKAILGKAGITIHTYACGYDSSSILQFNHQPPPKSMGNSSTPAHDMKNIEEIKQVLCTLCENLGKNLRLKRLRACGLQLYVRNEKLEWAMFGQTLQASTNNTQSIFDKAVFIFCKKFGCEPFCFRSIGVRASPLIYEGDFEQTSIFYDSQKEEKKEKLDKTIDILRSRFGNDCISRAILLENKDNARFDTGYEVFTSKR